MFEFTANQELAHAKVFYDALQPSVCRNLTVDGNYPIDLYPDLLGHLRAANHNELQEWEHDYAGFAKIAAEEGFDLISKTFEMIAGIEKTHAFSALPPSWSKISCFPLHRRRPGCA